MPLISTTDRQFLDEHGLPDAFLEQATKWYTPLLRRLTAERKQGLGSPIMVGIQGSQGSGKSTLADWLTWYGVHEYALRVEQLSIDDFYLSPEKRAILAERVHPLFQTRGVPGTHDTARMDTVLKELSKQCSTTIPRFKKALDRPFPEDKWDVTSPPYDIVVFEGWCWGTPPQPSEMVQSPVNALEKENDPKGVWRNFINDRLASHYAPLYHHMDFWVFLKAPSFEQVARWRTEQEHKLAQRHGRNQPGVMSDDAVRNFVQYFERLTRWSLEQMPSRCDVVYELDANRRIQKAKGLELDHGP